MIQRLLMLLLPDRFFWGDQQLTYSAKRLLARLAVFGACGIGLALALGLLTADNWAEVAAGALFAWTVSGMAWAVVSYRTGTEVTDASLRALAERDLLHARLNQVAAAVGAPLLNLNEGDLGGAIAFRQARHAHLSGLEGFTDSRYVTDAGEQFWTNTACGYPPT